ncbi:hypothetical protein [Ferrovibrio xuzhouensis]|uniref:Uncharacterized protein n=1 Tax=Ferrovibrio xuzhouensis TaxID=1576914 RepID=A0ABV7VC09_9PROT
MTKTAILHGPRNSTAEKVAMVAREHGFRVTHERRSNSNTNRLELFGPAACGKSRCLDAIAAGQRLDIVIRDTGFRAADGNYEFIIFRPARLHMAA